mmetsp:Transcript_9773/g.14291  ORF Transcript_9773/g.14291 Transcript_9773/m.14291 type:complete len:229 (+) Transcript_9773:85-771(+)|eukprot:CAMPEP_0195517066 /NCGR_PEP_ID=MMETSP0794_2-20130614/9544_1 /TAXON_ID=515487 /ORGANISM="Stephanopyxis turris, Strain CCMP 815" /LENGTH=228 /DNA_ID=CAMNT_0040645809 /DNA_START=85 /DNA_END=771 /DNA_ORIENTATION=+
MGFSFLTIPLVLVASVAFYFIVTDIGLFQNNAHDEHKKLSEGIGRRLDWIHFGNNGEVSKVDGNGDNDLWLDYDKEEIEEGMKTSGDSADELFDWDLCKQGDTYNRTNCPDPPECPDDTKLCINRVPTTDYSLWHVKIMKCIPKWENCDKCMCGKMQKQNHRKIGCKKDAQAPSDDRFEGISCDTGYEEIELKSKYLPSPQHEEEDQTKGNKDEKANKKKKKKESKGL